MHDWEKYEKEIYEKFTDEFPKCEIIKDYHIKGQFSLVERQIDIALIGKLTKYEMLGVIECKYFSKNIDVKIVESFISFLEDVGANVGIIITNKGYSEGAKNRAKVKGIRLEILTMEELEDYHFDWELCTLCDPGEDHPPAIIDFNYGYCIEKDEIVSLFDVGRCEWCNGINIRCHACGVVTGIYESQYEEEVECEGGCGLKIIVERVYEGSGMFSEEVRVFYEEDSDK